MPNNVEILNTVWDQASTYYQNRIPQATQTNIATVGDALTTYTVAMNEFVDALVNRIALVISSTKMANNRLKKFKKGFLEYGSDVEEFFTSMASAQTFNETTAETDVFTTVQPNVKSIFHRVNRTDFYKTTIKEGYIKRAFLSNDGLGKLVADIVGSLYSGDAFDEFVLMKELIAQYDGNYTEIDTPKISDQESAVELMRAIRQKSLDMTFHDNTMNAQGVYTHTDFADQVLLIHKEVETYLDTDLLAWAFHGEKMDWKHQKVVLNDFGSLAGVQAVLVDKNWFMVFDKLYETRNLYNPEGLYWNYWLHHHQTLSTSQFANAIIFKES